MVRTTKDETATSFCREIVAPCLRALPIRRAGIASAGDRTMTINVSSGSRCHAVHPTATMVMIPVIGPISIALVAVYTLDGSLVIRAIESPVACAAW